VTLSSKRFYFAISAISSSKLERTPDLTFITTSQDPNVAAIWASSHAI